MAKHINACVRMDPCRPSPCPRDWYTLTAFGKAQERGTPPATAGWVFVRPTTGLASPPRPCSRGRVINLTAQRRMFGEAVRKGLCPPASRLQVAGNLRQSKRQCG